MNAWRLKSRYVAGKRLAYLLVGGALLISGHALAAQAPSKASYRDLATFMDVYEHVKQHYVRDVDDHILIKGAIDGMLAALDPHSSYAERSDFDDLETLTKGNYGGLGLTTTVDNGLVKVVSASEGTPAWRAGIKSGDYLTRIDNELLYGLTFEDAVEKMRGPPGSQVQLTLFRPKAGKTLKITVTREVIQVPPVKWRVKEDVGVIALSIFNGNSAAETKRAIAGIKRATGGRPLGYILDLRSNGGGLLDQAVDVADIFLDRGEIVSKRGRSKDDIEHYDATPGDLTDGEPLIVLIDAGSASASEIVAGALQDHRRALVMGEPSFGKGSVQSIFPLGEERALRLTTELYYLPSGRSIQGAGIDPDIVVPQLTDDVDASSLVVREADLHHHLINQGVTDDKLLEQDEVADPRFMDAAAVLKKSGVDDFQLLQFGS